MLKRWTALTLVVIMLAGSFAFAEDTAAASEKPYTLAGLDNTQFGSAGIFGGASYRDWKENLFFTRMEELTGVAFELTQYTDIAAWKAAKAAMTAGADMPDVLFKASLSSTECIEMRERGAIIDLKPLLEENCPNLWAILEANPEYLKAITLPDGSIAALPNISKTPLQNCLWINKAWLETLKLAEPTTADELVKVLEAFRDRDPNGNGQRDEIPLGFLGAFDLKYLAHAFGLYANDYNIYVENDTVKFMPRDGQFREFITWCRDLYTAGLLDEDGFSTADTMRTVNDSDAKPTYGIILTTNAANLFATTWATDYLPMLPLSYNGETVYRVTIGNVQRGAFAITSACKEPEKMLKWIDTLYGEEGSKLAYIGLLNTDYLVDGDGTWRHSEAVLSDSFFTLNSLITGGGILPGIALDDYMQKYNDKTLVKITERINQVYALSKMPFPYCSLTRAQQEEVSAYQNAIGMYVDLQIARWVLGEIEISDESFALFNQELDNLGLQKFMSFWQGIYDNL